MTQTIQSLIAQAIEEAVPMSLAEEEERKRAEEERLRKEAATQAAADEAERQAVEHLRISHEAVSRAQKFEARRQEAQQTEPAYTGPSPEIVARIQKELKEVIFYPTSLSTCLLSTGWPCFGREISI